MFVVYDIRICDTVQIRRLYPNVKKKVVIKKLKITTWDFYKSFTKHIYNWKPKRKKGLCG